MNMKYYGFSIKDGNGEQVVGCGPSISVYDFDTLGQAWGMVGLSLQIAKKLLTLFVAVQMKSPHAIQSTSNTITKNATNVQQRGICRHCDCRGRESIKEQ